MLISKFLTPFLDKVCDTILNLLVHLRVAEHSNKLLHEVLAGDCFMERSIAPIHQDVQQAQTEEYNAGLRHCEPSKQLVGHHLSIGVTCIDLVNDLIDDLDGWPLVVLAGSLLDELGNLTLVH